MSGGVEDGFEPYIDTPQYLLLLLGFTTQVVEARGEEREKKEKVKYIDCADGLKA